jgi:hypothetical protein
MRTNLDKEKPNSHFYFLKNSRQVDRGITGLGFKELGLRSHTLFCSTAQSVAAISLNQRGDMTEVLEDQGESMDTELGIDMELGIWNTGYGIWNTEWGIGDRE